MLSLNVYLTHPLTGGREFYGWRIHNSSQILICSREWFTTREGAERDAGEKLTNLARMFREVTG